MNSIIRLTAVLLIGGSCTFAAADAQARADEADRARGGGAVAEGVGAGGVPGELDDVNRKNVELFRGGSLHFRDVADLIRALCEEAGARAPFSFCPDQSRKVVFVTSTTHVGNLPGVVAADFYCNVRAREAGHSGYFKAWISDSPGTAPAVTFTRLLADAGSYELPSGRVIANGWGDLVDGELAHPIDEDEFGNPLLEPASVWTGTAANGEHVAVSSDADAGPDCEDWTTAEAWPGNFGEPFAAVGFSDLRLEGWSFDPPLPDFFPAPGGPPGEPRRMGLQRCDLPRRLYCFEQ